MNTTMKQIPQPTLADLRARREALALDAGPGPELEALEAQIAELTLAEDRTAAADRERARRDEAARAQAEAERIAALRQRITLGYARRAALAAQADQQLASLRETVTALLREGAELFVLLREVKKCDAWSPAFGHDNDRLLGRQAIATAVLQAFSDLVAPHLPRLPQPAHPRVLTRLMPPPRVDAS
jgi:hypothetical protein